MKSLNTAIVAALTFFVVLILQHFAKKETSVNTFADTIRIDSISLAVDDRTSRGVFTVSIANLSAKQIPIVGVNTCCGSKIVNYPDVIDARGVATVIGEVSVADVPVEHEWHGVLFIDVGELHGIEFSFSQAVASLKMQ